MTDAENQTEQASISLRKSVGIYFAFLAVFIITLALTFSTKWFPSLICFVAYLGFGFYLNRVVLRNLIEYHPMYNTLDNVSSDKLKSFFLWPLSYAGLFFRLAVNKVL